MITKFYKLISVVLLGCSLINHAQAASFKPHVGADYKYWGVKPKQKDFQRDYVEIFPRITRAGTIYVGTRINKIWGIDVGYEHAADKDEWHTFDKQRFIFGTTSNIGDAVQVKYSLDAWYVSGLFYWELLPCFEVILHAGLASLQHKATLIYYPSGTGPLDLINKTKSKYSGRFGIGAQYLFLKHFGARALITFDQTSRLNIVGFNQNNSPFNIEPYRNSTSFNIGLFAEFNI